MESKTYTVCDIEKQIRNFDKRYSECKGCNIERGVKCYYDNKDKITIQQKIYYEKNREKLLEKQQITETKKTQIIKNYLDHKLS